MPEYRTRVKEVITPKFAVSFDKSVSVAEQSVKNYGLTAPARCSRPASR